MKTWIATIPTNQVSKRELLFRLRRRSGGKRWQFGIEVGTSSGYEHYQVRYECSNGDYEIERRYWGDIQLDLREGGGWSNYELKGHCFYSYLDDELGKYRFGRLQELQLCILAHRRYQSRKNRLITCVVDKRGGIGKTFLARRCWLNGTGAYIDGNGKTANIIADAYDITEDRKIDTFFIDLTRNYGKYRSELWSAIEQIKNGYLKDSRYALREKWITPPQIFVFCNHEPDWSVLSKDRWDKIFIKEKDNDHIEMWDRNEEGEKRVRTFSS